MAGIIRVFWEDWRAKGDKLAVHSLIIETVRLSNQVVEQLGILRVQIVSKRFMFRDVGGDIFMHCGGLVSFQLTRLMDHLTWLGETFRW